MKEEKFIKNEQSNFNIKHTSLEKFLYSSNELYINLDVILVDGSRKKLQIYFKHLLSLRNTDESYLLKTIEEQSKRDDFKWGGNLFSKVKNSKYVDWFNEESLGIPRDTGVTINHYAIYTSNDCIDVITSDEPEIKWLD